ncbi:MAG: cobalt ECF transporter T component CbiQ [Anaerobutyricum sp.]|nr:cobalt ECF transporter T component CbiQ [Anaerobutyricum sp.]
MNHVMIGLLIMMTAGMFAHGFWKSRKHHHHHRSVGHKHGGSVLSVDYYAYASHMRSWNATFKVIFSMLCLLLCLILNNIYVSIAVILIMGYMTVVIGGLELDHYISMLLIPIVFLLFGSAAIAVGFSWNPVGQYNLNVFGWFYIYCSQASLWKASGLIFKALGAVSALYMMTLTTPLSELIVVLRKAHIPKVIIELMNMIYRYIFIMLDTHSRMKNSAEARLGYVDFKTSCYSFGQVASNLLIVSLKRGTDYYNALESRCYNGDLQFLEEEKPIRKNQVAGAAVVVALLILIKIGA